MYSRGSADNLTGRRKRIISSHRSFGLTAARDPPHCHFDPSREFGRQVLTCFICKILSWSATVFKTTVEKKTECERSDQVGGDRRSPCRHGASHRNRL